MAKKDLNRNVIELECPECKRYRKSTIKNKKNDPERMTQNKYCPECRQTVALKETKK